MSMSGDYITGSTNPSIDIGVGLNLNMDQSIQDLSVLSDQLKQIRQDQEAYANLLSDSTDRIREMAQGYESIQDKQRQLLEGEKELRSIRLAALENIQDQTSAYQKQRDMVGEIGSLGNRMGGGNQAQGSYYGGQNYSNYGTGSGGYYGGGGGGGYGNYNMAMTPYMMGAAMGGYSRPWDISELRETGGPTHHRQGGGRAKELEGAAEGEEGEGKVLPLLMGLLGGEALIGGHGMGGGGGGHGGIGGEGGVVPVHVVSDTSNPLAGEAADSVLRYKMGAPAISTDGGEQGGDTSPGGEGGGGSGLRDLLTASSLAKMAGRYQGKGSALLGKVMSPSPGGILEKLGGAEGLARIGLIGAGVGAAAYGGKKIYDVGSDLLQEGQQYSSLTGGTGVTGALGYNLGAEFASGFGLNPLMPYGVSKQITQEGLGAGYRNGAGGYLGQYKSFAEGAYTHYGISPQESQQMFQAGVVQAGASAQSLSAALASLATTASTTQTSFQGMVASFIAGIQSFAASGAGAGSATLSAAAQQITAGQPGLQGLQGALQGVGLPGLTGEFQTPSMLLAQQLGVNPQNLAQKIAEMQKTPAGKKQLLAAQNAVVTQTFSRMGIVPGSKNELSQIATAASTGVLGQMLSPQLQADFASGKYTPQQIEHLVNQYASGATLRKESGFTLPVSTGITRGTRGGLIPGPSTTHPLSTDHLSKAQQLYESGQLTPALRSGVPAGSTGAGAGGQYQIELGPNAKQFFVLYGKNGKELGAYNSLQDLNAALGQGAKNTKKTHKGSM